MSLNGLSKDPSSYDHSIFSLDDVCAYSARMKLYEVKSSAGSVLQGDFIEV